MDGDGSNREKRKFDVAPTVCIMASSLLRSDKCQTTPPFGPTSPIAGWTADFWLVCVCACVSVCACMCGCGCVCQHVCVCLCLVMVWKIWVPM